MNKTRFQLPPRAKAAPGVDRWVAGGTEPDTSRRTDTGKIRWPLNPFAWMTPVMIDLEVLLTAQRRNIDALVEANGILLRCVMTIAQSNIAIMHRTADDVAASMRTMTIPGCPNEPSEMAAGAGVDAAADAREAGTMLLRAHIEAMEVLNQRFAEALGEAKSLTRYGARPPASPGRIIDVAFGDGRAA